MIEGVFVKRYKRFFVDVELSSGEIVTAHCVNTGRMTQCSTPGAKVFISKSDNPKRKLKYTLEFIVVNNYPVMVNTIRTNRIVEDLLLSKKIIPPFKFENIRREVVYGQNRSKVDFLLEGEGYKYFLEVKNVTMTDNMTKAIFPDAVTKRGSKHILELLYEIEKGAKAGILFAIERGECESFGVADMVDPEYGKLLREAKDKGLDIIPFKIEYDLNLNHIGGKVLTVDL
ncbi:MAG: DNA/RNA nuclease SfsA [Candidatus Cloacimonadota bacterium]|nr:MAG: DNA/RNA nuclease SfsA [Candidatus Cloacimonadota bacterium]PIE77796.1 MAG: DNA/RNA nuclease SfsA [Candidatus Delongbacteria bacterium]